MISDPHFWLAAVPGVLLFGISKGGFAGVALGVWLHKRVSDAFFYCLVYAFLLLTGAKLLYDGLSQAATEMASELIRPTFATPFRWSYSDPISRQSADTRCASARRARRASRRAPVP